MAWTVGETARLAKVSVRSLLAEKSRRTKAMLAAIDAALAVAEGGIVMSNQERKDMFGELFDGFDPAEYEEEARERWGETDAYKQSAARTSRYTKTDWAQIKAEGDANTAEFIRLVDAGIPADSTEGFAAAAEKHAQLEKWFYDAPVEMFGSLADMWVNDPRFKKNIDKPRAGLAEYERDAVKAWVASQPAASA